MHDDNEQPKTGRPDRTGPTTASVASIPRRGLLRSGAIVAGSAGVLAAASLANGPAAYAADGDNLLLGKANGSDSTTGLAIDAGTGTTHPTLQISNPSGPALEIPPVPASWSGDLSVGQIASLPSGPVIGVDQGNGVQNAAVAFDLDLDALSLPVAIAPVRVLDTRTDGGRASILNTSSATAIDAAGRLTAGQWLDLALAATDQTTIDAVFANLTVTGALARGFVSVYPGGDRPAASAINFVAGQAIANAGLFATGTSDGNWIIRIYTSSTTHVIIDVNGFTAPATPPTTSSARRTARLNRQQLRRRSIARRTIDALRRR